MVVCLGSCNSFLNTLHPISGLRSLLPWNCHEVCKECLIYQPLLLSLHMQEVLPGPLPLGAAMERLNYSSVLPLCTCQGLCLGALSLWSAMEGLKLLQVCSNGSSSFREGKFSGDLVQWNF